MLTVRRGADTERAQEVTTHRLSAGWGAVGHSATLLWTTPSQRQLGASAVGWGAAWEYLGADVADIGSAHAFPTPSTFAGVACQEDFICCGVSQKMLNVSCMKNPHYSADNSQRSAVGCHRCLARTYQE